jgi:hypothetical protein
MMKLSTGQNSTLGSYLRLCQAVFGEDSEQVKFIQDKITESPNGADEEVVAEESQMLYLLVNLPPKGTEEMEELLS